jgi:hypothetical protein
MSLSIPVSRRALRQWRALDIQAPARVGAPWDCNNRITDLVNDTLLASGFAKADSPCMISPEINRSNSTSAMSFREDGRALPSSTRRWAAHAAMTARVRHD